MPSNPVRPAWQEQIAGVDRRLAARVAREFARNAEVTEGRSMICMGAGHKSLVSPDQVYRTFLALVMLCGCEGRNGGGWAHYVGQEKVRPLTGWQTVASRRTGSARRAFSRAPRSSTCTPASGAIERIQPEHLASPLGRGLLKDRHIADVNALGARLGWLPSYPSFDRSSLGLVDEAERAGVDPATHVVDERVRAVRLPVGPRRAWRGRRPAHELRVCRDVQAAWDNTPGEANTVTAFSP